MTTFTPSPYEKDIFNFVADGEGNGAVNAVAGSGKTTTLSRPPLASRAGTACSSRSTSTSRRN